MATWQEGDEKWAYRENAWKHIDTQKVSLDPYRFQSRKIFACIREHLPAPPVQRVEKASVDEVFLDLSAHVHSILLERYPELSQPAPYDDPTEKLPRPPTTALDWDTDALVDLDATETEDDDPDWDDIVVSIGSEIVRGVRAAVREQLKYTCSAGIARNKMIAKLGAGHKKPNQQTIVRTRAIQHFLSGFKFTKIRNLGGKLGDEVVETFGTDQVIELRNVSIEQMKLKLGDDTGSWVYQIIRGNDTSEVNPRTQIKSMLSAKSFRPTINSVEQAHRWLRIFVADIFSRLVEEGVLENKRRPKTMNLHHRQGAQTRSRQAPISTGRSIDEAMLFDIAKNILAQIVVDGRAWPCSNLSLSVGGFEEGPTSNKGISSFLIRGDEARAVTNSTLESRHASPAEELQTAKRRKTGNSALPSFFTRQSTSYGESSEASDQRERSTEHLVDSKDSTRESLSGNEDAQIVVNENNDRRDQSTKDDDNQTKSAVLSYTCERCGSSIPSAEKDEHEDWHFARDLQKQEQATPTPIPGTIPSKKKGPGRSAVQPSTSKEVEKGQRRLVFGK